MELPFEGGSGPRSGSSTIHAWTEMLFRASEAGTYEHDRQ